MILYSSSYLFSYLSRLCFRIYLIEDNIRQGGGHGGEGENDLHVLGADGILGQTEVAQKSTQLPSLACLAFFALQIKSEIPRLGLSYPRSYHCINFTPYHSFRAGAKNSSPR